MTLHLDPESVPAFVAGLRGVTDVDGGATDEQERVVQAVARHLWAMSPVTYDACVPCTPDDVAEGVPDEEARRRFVQLGIVLERAATPTPWRRYDGSASTPPRWGSTVHSSMPSAPGSPATRPWRRATSCAAARRSVGWSYLRFYARHGFPLPGRHTPEPAYYVSHDMNHVIAGYEPTGPGEISLGAFKLAMSDTDANWMAFVANLMIHEGGMIKHGTTEQAQFVPCGGDISPDASGQGALHLPGAAEELAEALERGGAVEGDFSQIDHLAIAQRPLAEIRDDYHVVARRDGFDEGLAP